MRFSYVWREISLRRRRHLTAIFGLSIGIGLLVVLQVLSGAYKEAARMPLQAIGADISIQRSGDVPQELQGAVFPCSAVTIGHKEVEQISTMSGVRAVGQAILMWVFDKDQFTMLLGLDPSSPLGPGKLRNFLTKGRFLEGDGPQALVDATYARDRHLDVGGVVTILDKQYPIVGLVDASRASKIAVANVYLPLRQAQAVAKASPQVQGVSPFEADDVNLVFVLADQGAIPHLSKELKQLLGDKTTVASPDSFLRQLGNLFALSDKFAAATSFIVMVVAFLMVFKTIAGNIQERSREIGVLKCLGWTNGDVIGQLLTESLTECFLSGLLGLALAWGVCFVLGLQQVKIPIPWEMSPTPHFLPGGGEPVFKTVALPAHLSWSLSFVAVALSLLVGGVTSILCIGRITRIKPSEVLRHE